MAETQANNAAHEGRLFCKKCNKWLKEIEFYAAKDKTRLDLCKKWSKSLKLEEAYLKIDNEFDLLYKNNKLNYNKNLTRWSIILFVIAIIIGIINLLNMM